MKLNLKLFIPMHSQINFFELKMCLLSLNINNTLQHNIPFNNLVKQ